MQQVSQVATDSLDKHVLGFMIQIMTVIIWVSAPQTHVLKACPADRGSGELIDHLGGWARWVVAP